MFQFARNPAVSLFLPAVLLAVLFICLCGGTAVAAEAADSTTYPVDVADEATASGEMTAVTAAEPVPATEETAPPDEDGAQTAAVEEAITEGEIPADAQTDTTVETNTADTAQITPDAPQAPDHNNDGNSELALLYNYHDHNTGLWLFDPNGGGYSAPRNVWTSGIGNWDWERTKMTTSDYNGDGKSELAVLYNYDNANTGLWLFDPVPGGYSAPRNVWTSGVGNWDWNRSRFTTGDCNGDNKTELVVLYDYGNSTSGLWLFDPIATGYKAPRNVWVSSAGSWDTNRSKLTASDYNGDGATEIAVLYDYENSNTSLWLFDPNGSGYSAPREVWESGAGNWDWPRSKLVLSDYNNDNKSEIAVLYSYNGSNTGLWIFEPNATGYSAPRNLWTSGNGNWEWLRSRMVASDFNGDGKSEIGILYSYNNSQTGLWLFDPNGSGYSAPRNTWASGEGNWEWIRSKVPNSRNFKARYSTTGVEWIDINLSTQTLRAMGSGGLEVEERFFIKSDGAIMSTLIASGAAGSPTPTGNFHVYGMNMYTDMAGPGYYAPDVPFVLWFTGDYSIHGTYWHNSFGAPRSHGCVNLPTPAAEWLFYRSHIGMPVIVHY